MLLFPNIAYTAGRSLVVVYTEWYPYTYKENGSAKGFEIDTFRAVIKEMNLNAEFHQLPWKRCLKMLSDGEADVVISLLKTPEREKYTIFPNENISLSKTVFFAKTGKNIKYKGNLRDLQGLTIGVIAGFSYGSTFDKADYLKKDEVLNAETMVKMVVRGRHDVGVENQAVIKWIATKLAFENQIRFLYPPVHTNKLYVGFSKKKALNKLANDFSESLGRFKKTDEYKAILNRYGIAYSDMVLEDY